MKIPFLSTAFSENGKRAKKRMDNILTPAVKRGGVLLVMGIIMLTCILNMAVKKNKTEPVSGKSAVAAIDCPLYMNPELTQTYSEYLEKGDLVSVLFYSGDRACYVRKAAVEAPAPEGYIAKEKLSFDVNAANQGIINADCVYSSKNENDRAGYKIDKGISVCTVNSIDGGWANISLPGGIDDLWIPVKDIIYDLSYDAENSGEHYDLIKSYMQKHFSEVYSPYYDNTRVNKLSGYSENYDENTGSIEAEFVMNTSFMNYYKDPDTVEYIQKAKQSGDEETYKTLYREYNQIKDGNYILKFTGKIKNNKIVEKSVILYSNDGLQNDNWVQLKDGLKDFIMV